MARAGKFLRRLAFAGVVAGGLVALSGCANAYDAPFKPPAGAIVTQVAHPLTAEDFGSGIVCDGLAKQSHTTFFFLWPYPNISLAWNEKETQLLSEWCTKVKTVSYADVEVFTVFGLFGRYTVNLYGEPSGK